jgi:hypothetical protein
MNGEQAWAGDARPGVGGKIGGDDKGTGGAIGMGVGGS